MDFSFIIPCLDEEKRISWAVRQFTGIKGYSFEVIVADGGSIDRTREIAKRQGAIIVKNHREAQNIAKNRNLGAKHARGDILVFCDADTRLHDVKKFLWAVQSKFSDRRIIAASPRIEVAENENLLHDKVFHFFFNFFVRLSFFLGFPFSGGQCQIVRKKDFVSAGGYDETIVHGEDSMLFQKLAKKGRIHFFPGLVAYESARRYRKWGYLKLMRVAVQNILSQYLFRKETIKKWEKIN